MENLIYVIYSLALPVVFIITGLMIWKRPSPYGGLGYRTEMSAKNPVTWQMAQMVSGKTFTKTYAIALPLSALASSLLVILKAANDLALTVFLVILALQVLLLIPVIVITERTLRRCFDKDGNPRQ